jgi:hypothetical protein
MQDRWFEACASIVQLDRLWRAIAFGRLALAAGRSGAGHVQATSAQALAALTDSSAAPRVRLSRSLAGLARALLSRAAHGDGRGAP